MVVKLSDLLEQTIQEEIKASEKQIDDTLEYLKSILFNLEGLPPIRIGRDTIIGPGYHTYMDEVARRLKEKYEGENPQLSVTILPEKDGYFLQFGLKKDCLPSTKSR